MIVTHAMRRLVRWSVHDREAAWCEAEEGLAAVDAMRQLAATAGIPDQGLEFQRDTFALLALARDYFLRDFTPEIADRLVAAKANYLAKYKRHYRVKLDFAPTRLRKYHLRLLHLLLFRQQRRYRWIDHLLALRLLPLIHPLVRLACQRFLPKSLRRQAMGIDVVFR